MQLLTEARPVARGRAVAGYNGSPLERFLRKCRFDAGTGCVLWTGGTSAGRGHSARYGSFWYEGERWAAHRWAAKFIHNLNIDGLQVDHCCDKHTWLDYPNTLCVQHVEPLTLFENRERQTINMRAAAEKAKIQNNEQRYSWVRVMVGLDEAPPAALPHEAFTSIPFFEPPAWLRSLAA